MLVGSRLVIKHSASLSNTKALCTRCAPPLVTAGKASACWGRKSELAGRAGRKKKAGEGWARAQKQRCDESERKLMQLLVPAPRASLHHQQVLQGCRAAHSLSPAATGDAAAQAPVPAPLPQAGIQPGAQPVPTTWAGITLESPPGRIQAGQRSGAALLIRAQWFSGHLLFFFFSLMTSTKTARAGTHCILGHLKAMW